jgi:hypothetical protein
MIHVDEDACHEGALHSPSSRDFRCCTSGAFSNVVGWHAISALQCTQDVE